MIEGEIILEQESVGDNGELDEEEYDKGGDIEFEDIHVDTTPDKLLMNIP